MTSTTADLPAVIARRRAEATRSLVTTLGKVGELGVRTATVLAPRGPTSNYVEGLDATTRGGPAGMSVTIGGRAPHSHLVERGRQPGRMPPARKIATLFSLPLSQAFVVARAIGRHGTTGAEVLGRTADRIRPSVRQLAADLARQVGALR